MKLNSSEIGYIIIGCIAAIAQGGVQPVFAIVFSSIIGVSLLGSLYQNNFAVFAWTVKSNRVFHCSNVISMLYSCLTD